VLTRFSTVAGERGLKDTARDARGFAVMVPELLHALKLESHNGIPQAASAHDTFWDFVSLMQGFGVHTFRLINEQGQSVFCKFHWTPLQGTPSLVWDEAVKISGADADFHRRDLWESIELDEFPEWERGLLTPVGRMVLNRNPGNFFAETEQVAFCTAHIAAALRFELSKVGVRTIRKRMVSSLLNVSAELSAEVAAGLGMQVPEAMPKVITDSQAPEVSVSAALSLMALPGDLGIHTRQIAVLLESGVHHASLVALYGALTDAGAVVSFVGPRMGMFVGDTGEKIEANKSLDNSPAVLFDALIVPDGSEAIQAIAGNGHGVEFIKDLFRHGKTILALGAGRELLEMAGIGPVMNKDEGILLADGAKATEITPAFIDAIAAHRHPSRVQVLS